MKSVMAKKKGSDCSIVSFLIGAMESLHDTVDCKTHPELLRAVRDNDVSKLR